MSFSIVCEKMNNEVLNIVLDILKENGIKAKLKTEFDNKDFKKIDEKENSIKWTRGLALMGEWPKYLG